MADRRFYCSYCGAKDLESFVCPDCNNDIRDVGQRDNFNIDTLWSSLVARGLYWDCASRTLALPFASEAAAYRIQISGDNRQERLIEHIHRVANVPRKLLTKTTLDELFCVLAEQLPSEIPRVQFAGDRPQLFVAEDGSLYFPTVLPDQPRTRIMPLPVQDYFYYTGPPLVPQDHGGLFEDFLSTVRCADEENRAVLRCWCYSLLLSNVVGEGGFPALLLAADQHGTGKTTTAQVVASIFGRPLMVEWKSAPKKDHLMRQLLDPDYRFLIGDNLRNQGGALIDDSSLASLITARELAVTQLYASQGSAKTPNLYQYIMTANQPLFSAELLSRFVVCTLNKHAQVGTVEYSWAGYWAARRRELLEDVMWHVIQNWQRGPCGSPPPYRFDDWWRAAARATQAPPVIVPRHTAVKSPLELVIDRVWAEEGADPLAVAAVVSKLQTATTGQVADIARQSAWDEELVVEEVRNYSRKYEVFESGEKWWLRRSEA